MYYCLFYTRLIYQYLASLEVVHCDFALWLVSSFNNRETIWACSDNISHPEHSVYVRIQGEDLWSLPVLGRVIVLLQMTNIG